MDVRDHAFRPERLKELREKAGLSRAEAARRMHLSASGYSNYENGLRIPSWQVLFVMAAILGSSVEYLSGRTDDDSSAAPEMSNDTEIVDEYEKLPKDIQKAVLTLLREINKAHDL